MGNISDMPAVYSVADIVLSTSLSQKLLGEFLPRDVQCQNLLFQPTMVGAEKLLKIMFTGWLVEPIKNPEDLANKIIYVLNLNQKEKGFNRSECSKKIRERF